MTTSLDTSYVFSGIRPFTGPLTAPAYNANLTGTTGRYVGQTNGSPTGQPYTLGDWATDPTNTEAWICTASGTPGTWAAISGGGGSSPLTTKGDLFGFSTVNARLPVGTDGRILEADSGQTLGVGYSTHDFDFNSKNLANAASVQTGSFSSSNAQHELASSWGGAAAIRIGGTYTGNPTQALVVSGSFTSATKILRLIDFSPSVTLASGLAFTGLNFNPSFSGTGNSMTGINIAAPGGTWTTIVGITIGLTSGLALNCTGAANSVHAGKFAFGGTTTPTWNVHSQGAAAAANGLGVDFSTTAATAPASNGSWVVSAYKSATPNYYILYTLNDAGTTKYLYFKINGVANGTATWTVATSLPA